MLTKETGSQTLLHRSASGSGTSPDTVTDQTSTQVDTEISLSSRDDAKPNDEPIAGSLERVDDAGVSSTSSTGETEVDWRNEMPPCDTPEALRFCSMRYINVLIDVALQNITL